MEFYTDGLKSSTGSGGFEKNNFCRCRERRAVGSKIMSLPTKEFQLSITSDLCQFKAILQDSDSVEDRLPFV